jgi:hydrogenase expression/formation protein HypC
VCLGLPGEIVSLYDAADGELRIGRVAFGSVHKDICLAYVPEAGVGDFVIVHAGFAISKLDRAAALRVFDYLEALPEKAR